MCMYKHFIIILVTEQVHSFFRKIEGNYCFPSKANVFGCFGQVNWLDDNEVMLCRTRQGKVWAL